jgi:hypothetical protein
MVKVSPWGKENGGDTMTQREKLAKAKMSLIELEEYLKNVSEACRVMGVSRQHFYDIKKAYAEGGMLALQEKSRRKPNFKHRVAPEIEAAVAKKGRGKGMLLEKKTRAPPTLKQCLRAFQQSAVLRA